MLLYDFGSKQRLVADVLAEIRRREERLLDAEVSTLEDVWAGSPRPSASRSCGSRVYVQALKRGEASAWSRIGSRSSEPGGRR